MTCSSRSTSAVGPAAMSLPKSSTAVSSQHADTRLMSWSTRITSAPMCSGIERITRLRCSVSSSGRPADDGARDLDQAALARAQAADLDVRVELEPDELDGADDVVGARGAPELGVLVDHRHVVVDRQLLDRLFGLEG